MRSNEVHLRGGREMKGVHASSLLARQLSLAPQITRREHMHHIEGWPG